MRGVPMKIGTPLLWLSGTVVLGAIVVARGAAIANAHLDYSLHDTYYLIANFHFGLSLQAAFLVFTAVYAVMRYLFRVRYSEALGQAHFWTMFLGALMVLAPPMWLDRVGGEAAVSDPVFTFAFWSGVMTLGYLLSLLSLIFFAAVVIGALRHRLTPADGAIET
jgi:cytochrome c oxidase subunit I